MDENEAQELKPGSGWRLRGSSDRSVWLLVDAEGAREVALARWRAGLGGALVQDTQRVRLELMRNWVQVPQEQVDELMAQLMRTEAADAVHQVRDAARKHEEAAAGAAVDREREAARAEALTVREGRTAVPVEEKSYWGGPREMVPAPPHVHGLTADKVILDEATEPPADLVSQEFGVAPGSPRDKCRTILGLRKMSEVRANAPMEERAGVVPPRKVVFPHDYPGAPGHDPSDPSDCFTSDCRYECGAWAGPSRSGGPEGVDPFGECPKHPELLAVKGSRLYRELVDAPMAELEALYRAAEERDRNQQLLGLADSLEEWGSRMIYEARTLRRLAGVSDEEHAREMMTSDGGSDDGRS